MSCSKYVISNPNPFPIVYSYQECSSLVWFTNQIVYQGQTKKVWARTGTFSSASINAPLPSAFPFPVTPSQAPVQVLVQSCCTGQQIDILVYPGVQLGYTYLVNGECYTVISLTSSGRVSPTVYTPLYDNCSSCIGDNTCPTPTPTRTSTVTPTQTSTSTVTPTPTKTVTPTATPTRTTTPTPTVTRTPTTTPSLTKSPTPTLSVTQSSTPTSTPNVSATSTPTVTPTVTPTSTFVFPTPTPSPTNKTYCEEIRNGDFDECNPTSSTTGVSCGCYTNPTIPDQRQYPGGCIPFWTKGNSDKTVEIWTNVPPYYSGTSYCELNSSAFTQTHWMYQNFTVSNYSSPYTIEFGHAGRNGYANTMRVGISGNTTGLNMFPTVYTGIVGTWTTNQITGYTFNSSDTEFLLIFSSLTSNNGGNFIDGVSVRCEVPYPTPTPTPTQEFCADVRNGNFEDCNPFSDTSSLACNCYTGGSSNVTSYIAGCIPFWNKGDSNDHVTIWSNTSPLYSGNSYLELNAFVTPTTPPSPTPTPSLTIGTTPTPTVTPSPTSALLTLGVYVSVDSSIPAFSGTVWYSVRNGAYISTQPYPTNLTWTQLGSTVLIPQCNSSVYVGDIDMNVNDITYLQVRNENGTCLYRNEAGPLPTLNPCTFPGAFADLYTNSFIYATPGNTDLRIKVLNPIQKTASPFGFPWIYQDINVTNIASPYSIEFAHLGRVGYSNTMRVGVSGNTTGMQFFTGEFTGSTTGWTVHTETGYVFNASDTQRRLVFSSTTCDDGGNFIDGVVMDCQNFAVTTTPTPTLSATPTITPSVTPSCAQSVFIFIPNL
jgi:hypothetical protein